MGSIDHLVKKKKYISPVVKASILSHDNSIDYANKIKQRINETKLEESIILQERLLKK